MFPFRIDPAHLQLTVYRGSVALIGDALDFARPGAGHPYIAHPHTTLFSAAEYKSLGRPDVGTFSIPLDHIYVLGSAERGAVRWLVIVLDHGNVCRRSNGLADKDFHVTTSAWNVHHIDKGVSTLSIDQEALLDGITRLGTSGMDHVAVACGAASLMARSIAERMITTDPTCFRGFARYAEIMFSVDPKIAMLSFAQAARLNPALLPKIVTRLRSFVDACSFGPTVSESERERISPALLPYLLQPWPVIPLSTTLWTNPTTSRERQIYLDHRMPRFFSWVYPERIAGMSTPSSEADIDVLVSMGFTHVLTLTQETPLPPVWFEAKDVRNVYVPVPNYGAPTLQEMDAIWRMIQAGGVWLIHCGGGVGRAGTVLTCLIAALGTDDAPSAQPRFDAQTAIRLLRHARPRSLETASQEAFVSSWVSHRWKLAHSSTHIDEPVTMLKHVSASVLNDLLTPTVLFLIGKPGSGKSWLSSAIVKRRPHGTTIVISQDEAGSRSMCERQLSRDYASDVLVILDRCNPSATDRRLWLSLTSRRVVAVYFDYPTELCRQRIDARLDHPTLRAGRGGNALDQMQRQMSEPRIDEGFACILTISSFAAAREAIERLTPDLAPLKFPRTPHLLNLGAVAKDDILLDEVDSFKGYLTIEEKIDGANMGISLSYDGDIRVQNRSHWVSSANHAQFKPLDTWVRSHAAALRQILDRDSQYPERYILYGEWVVAKHSILYSSLPDRFIAFDFYDRLHGTFASRSVLTRLLAEHNLHQVPLLQQTDEIAKVDILRMLQQPSAFSDVTVEGVYIRFEDARRSQTVRRGKVVRGDFITGNQHWSKGVLTLNGIVT